MIKAYNGGLSRLNQTKKEIVVVYSSLRRRPKGIYRYAERVRYAATLVALRLRRFATPLSSSSNCPVLFEPTTQASGALHPPSRLILNMSNLIPSLETFAKVLSFNSHSTRRSQNSNPSVLSLGIYRSHGRFVLQGTAATAAGLSTLGQTYSSLYRNE